MTTEQQQRLSLTIKPGQKYKHFRNGHVYEIVDVAIHTETREILVIYKYENEVWARTYSQFMEKVAPDTQRFTRIDK